MKRLLILVAFAMLAGCADDPASSNNSTTNNATNNATNSSTNNTQNNMTTNNTVADMGVTDMAADMATELDAGMDAEADAEVDAFMYPDLAQDPCAFPSTDVNCPTGPYGPGSFMTSIIIPEQPTCCFDFNGDGVIDNKIGALLATAKSLGFDVNTGIANAIDAGTLVNLFGFSNFENAMYDPTLDLSFYKGTDTDLNILPNLQGLGEFYVLAESLNTQGQPRWGFASARVRAGFLEAFDGEFDLDFPDLLDEVRIPVAQGRIEAAVLPGANLAAGGTVTLDEGKMGGVVLRDEFFDSLNAASNACFCLSRNVYDRETDGGYSCNSVTEDEVACMNATSGCRFLASKTYCGLLGTAISNAVDVDTDNDGKNDSYSFGATFTGVGASIIGNEP